MANKPTTKAATRVKQTTASAKSSAKAMKSDITAKKAMSKEELEKLKAAEAEAANAKAAEATDAAKAKVAGAADAAGTTAASSKQAVGAVASDSAAKTVGAAEAGVASTGAIAGSSASAGSSAAAGTASAAGAKASGGAASPWAVGAGILGVAAVAAAASGGGDGGSSSTPTANNTQSNTNQGTTENTSNTQGGGAAQNGNNAQGTTTDPANQGTGNAQTPATPTGPAAAGGTADAPLVATTGITNLKAETFAGTTDATQQPQFLKIINIFAQESAIGTVQAGEAGARVIRFGDAAATPRAEGDAPTAAEALTAYEVIDAGKAITLAEAQAMAAALGGKLLVIDDATELGWVKQNLNRLLGGYDAGTASKTDGAWVGTSNVEGASGFDALIRQNDANNPQTEFYKAAADQKFTRFVVEINNYKSPLLLNGTPVVEGQVITAADYAKLSWDSTQNQFGRIYVAPATGTDDNRPLGEIPANQIRAINLSESANVKAGSAPVTPPTPATPNAGVYDADNTQELDVGYNAANHKVPATLFAGTDAAKKPEFIKIIAVTPTVGQGAEAGSALFINEGDATKRIEIPNDAGGVFHISTLDNLVWDASANTGGKFTFVAVADARGTAIAGAKEQTVNVTEAPASYKPADVAKVVDKDTSTTLEAALFGGSKENVANPAFVRILSVTETADEHSTRVVNGATAYEVFKVDAGISFADAQAEAARLGGTLLKVDTAEEAAFVKTSLLSKLDASDGSDAAKAAWMLPADAAIAEGADKEVLYNNGGEVGYADREAAATVNNFIVEYANYGAQKPGLKLEGQPVNDNAVLNSEQLGKLTWDSLFNNGGKITFIQVADAQGAELEGAAQKVINVTEAPAAADATAVPKSFASTVADELEQHIQPI